MLDWWNSKAVRSNVVTRNYMQTNMPGNYVYYCIDDRRVKIMLAIAGSSTHPFIRPSVRPCDSNDWM